MNSEFRMGTWDVNVAEGWIRSRRWFRCRRIYPDSRLFRVLTVFLENPEKTITTDDILEKAWNGRVVCAGSVSTAIYQLRILLNDESGDPSYIRTIPREGYRLVARISERPYPRYARPANAAAAILAIGLAAAFAYQGSSELKQLKNHRLSVTPLQDITGDPELHELSVAIEATLFSSLVRENPGLIVVDSGNAPATHQLEAQIVACDTGPALVIRLLDIDQSRYLWSKYYGFYGEETEPSLVEYVAREVTAVLEQT